MKFLNKEKYKEYRKLYLKQWHNKNYFANRMEKLKKSKLYWSKTNYYEKNKEIIIQRARDFYYNNREQVLKLHRDRKDKIKVYQANWFKNNKEKLKLYRKRRKFANKIAGNLTLVTIQQVYKDNIKKYGILTCYLCKNPIKFGNDHLEHKTPLSRGGTNDYKNLAVACQKCNCSKNNRTELEYIRIQKERLVIQNGRK